MLSQSDHLNIVKLHDFDFSSLIKKRNELKLIFNMCMLLSFPHVKNFVHLTYYFSDKIYTASSVE